MPALIAALVGLGVNTRDGELHEIFFSTPQKTKLEQFFRLLYFIQKQKRELPVLVTPPGITEVLLTARVFSDASFPVRIRQVRLDRVGSVPRYTVSFDSPEVRFPLNDGLGFMVWERGMCQWARELVFRDGFSFTLRESDRNLVVDEFQKAELVGNFGTRGIFDIDLNYVDLERVEFIAGTDQGRVKTRVSEREFVTNPHSFLFRFIGRLIPDTSRQRIDW